MTTPLNSNYNSLSTAVYDIKRDFGALGDGISDDTAAWLKAQAATTTNTGGGIIDFPPGTYILQTSVLNSFTHIRGSGIEATVLKLKSGTNGDLIQGLNAPSLINIGGANGTGSTGGIANWSISDLTLDGNKAGQTSGPSYPLRAYGYGFILQNVRVRNGFSGGIQTDWNGGGTASFDSMEAQMIDVKSHDNAGIGIEWGGPHDSHWANILSFKNDSHGVHIGPNASAMLIENAHCWGSKQGVSALGWLIEGGYGQYTNCIGEGSDTVHVAILAGEISWSGGHIFGATGQFATSNGIQIGQVAGGTPYNGSVNQSAGLTTAVQVGGYYISGIFSRCEGPNGALWFVNDTGGVIIAQAFQQAGSCYTGTPAAKTMLLIHVTGLTPDGTQAKGGTFILPINAFSAFVARDDNLTDIFNLNTRSKLFQTPNNVAFKGYKDAYATLAFQLNPDGNGSIFAGGSLASGQSATAQALTTGGTISTNGIGVAREAPAAAVTGIILQAGVQQGQMCVVVNESATANSITMAASGSNVSGGSSVVIAGGAKLILVWDSSTNLWY